MSERMTPEALDRYLDALVVGHEEAEPDSELAGVARRYLALGQAPAPPGARERVLQHVTRQGGHRKNGHHVPLESFQRQIVLPQDGKAPGPEILRQTATVVPVRRMAIPWRTWPAFLLVLIGLVAAIAWLQARPTGEQVLVAPAETTQTPVPTPPAADGQALFTVDLPPGSLPVEAYGVTFDYRTMPPQRESSEVSEGPLLLRYIVSGQVQVQSDAPLDVWNADSAGMWQPVPARTPLALGAGDAIFLRGAAALEWKSSAEPVEMIAWQMTDQGGGNSEVPSGWTLHDQAAVHMAVFEHQEQPTHLVLRRIELAPGNDITPPAGTWLSHFVALDRNAAGETVAPMFGKLPGGAWRNAGRQELTLYQYSLNPLETPASPAADGTP